MDNQEVKPIAMNFNRVYYMSWLNGSPKHLYVWRDEEHSDIFDDNERTQDLYARYTQWLKAQGML